MADIILSHSDCIVNYIQHDSLFKNLEEEKLTEQVNLLFDHIFFFCVTHNLIVVVDKIPNEMIVLREFGKFLFDISSRVFVVF